MRNQSKPDQALGLLTRTVTIINNVGMCHSSCSDIVKLSALIFQEQNKKMGDKICWGQNPALPKCQFVITALDQTLYTWTCMRNVCSPSWELELRPLGVATGNALSVTRSEDTYEKTPPVGRRQPMTSLPAYHNISAAGRYIISFFVFTDWFVWSVQSESGKSTVF